MMEVLNGVVMELMDCAIPLVKSKGVFMFDGRITFVMKKQNS